MIDAVFGEQQDRTLRGRAQVEKSLSDGAHRRRRLAVGESTPPASLTALREEEPVRCGLGPTKSTQSPTQRAKGPSGSGDRRIALPSSRRSTATWAGANRMALLLPGRIQWNISGRRAFLGPAVRADPESLPEVEPYTHRRARAAAIRVGVRGALLLLASCATPAAPPAPPPPSDALEQLHRDARALRPLVHSALALQFLDATAGLPHPAPRLFFKDPTPPARFEEQVYYSPADADRLPPEKRATLIRIEGDDDLYYNTKYGTPLAYARPLDVLADHGFVSQPGQRILDFGFGTLGHLRLLASLGFDATGVDVDPMLSMLYDRPEDQGDIAGWNGGPAGHLKMVVGRYPADAATAAAVGKGYDLIVSKNTLKKGYIHPDRPADPKLLIQLGVDDAAFLGAFRDALKPGGWLLSTTSALRRRRRTSPSSPGRMAARPSPARRGRAPAFRWCSSIATTPRPSVPWGTRSGGIVAMAPWTCRAISR